LPTGERSVSFLYTAPYLLPTGALRFRFRLDGVDTDWVQAGERREVFYGQLPPGKYTFRVAAQNATGDYGQEDSLTIVVPHRFYETSWFRGLMAALAATVILGVLVTQVRVIRAQRRVLLAEEQKKRAEDESRRRRDQLTRMARVASLGELATSIAHEVNQPLSAIVSNARAASRMMDAPSPDLKEIHAALEDIATGGNMAAEVIKRVRSLVTMKHVPTQPVDLNRLVQEVVELVTPDMTGRRVAIQLDLADNLPLAMGDAVELQQVLLNLLINGAQAMRDTEPESRLLVVRTDADDGQLVVSVKDHGVGLDADVERHMFEPFFTTKPGGIGMGLSINRTIIEFHGGRLWATNNTDRGATFQFTIPACDDQPSSRDANQELTP
jgi:C4-dicarboxylate-specific signal transduction histidine kinase